MNWWATKQALLLYLVIAMVKEIITWIIGGALRAGVIGYDPPNAMCCAHHETARKPSWRAQMGGSNPPPRINILRDTQIRLLLKLKIQNC